MAGNDGLIGTLIGVAITILFSALTVSYKIGQLTQKIVDLTSRVNEGASWEEKHEAFHAGEQSKRDDFLAKLVSEKIVIK